SWIIKPDFYFTTERLSKLVKDSNLGDLQVKAREEMRELEVLVKNVLREFKEGRNQLDESMDDAMLDICDRLYNCKIAALSAAIAKHTVDDNSFWTQTPIGNILSQKLEELYPLYFLQDLSLVCVETAANENSENINDFIKKYCEGLSIFKSRLSTFVSNWTTSVVDDSWSSFNYNVFNATLSSRTNLNKE
ncbi:MAG: hypothetical protein NTU49_06505, partial [Gammaproteobacteria bacterium]|nr:hypothetical protein [Gammaproteobacteria bacterium]